MLLFAVWCCLAALHAGTINGMTTIGRLHARGRVPADTFPVRLAIVRAEMGWNYDQAARATGIGSETWRLWEKRKRHCTTLEQTCRTIEAATGFSYEWLMVGGALDASPTDPNGAPVMTGWRTRRKIKRLIRPTRHELVNAA